MLLDFIQHIIKSSSLMFVKAACQLAHFTDTQQSSTEFSRWVVGRLLRVAASPNCDVIHGRASAVLCSLLHALRPRAPITFNVIAKEMLGLAQDLSNLLCTHTLTHTHTHTHSHSHTPGTHTHFTNTHTLWPLTLQSLSVSLTPHPSSSPRLPPWKPWLL
uniref:Serine/threonine-protein kinase ATR-like N-HEAT region domain-containing protein n=1 Tax=Hucho hucho TaxID=62062 RepID=A0A4W5QY32_9TELE